MTTDPTTILDTIDNAIRDWQTSPDAMRWTPEPPPADRGASEAGDWDWVARAGEGDDLEFTPCGQFADITPPNHCPVCEMWGEPTTAKTAS